MTDKIKNPPEANFLDMGTVMSVSNYYGSLARSAKFLVRILPGNTTGSVFLNGSSTFMRDFTYLCESAEFPSRGFVSTDVRYYGPNFKMPYQTSYEDLNLVFLCRNDFREREFFDSWMEVINPSSTYDFTYRDNYVCKIEIYQLNELAAESGRSPAPATYKFSFEKAYPININPQPVTWADDNFHRLQITFTFTRWRRDELDSKYLGSFDLTDGNSTSTTKVVMPRFNAG